ncbi:MAG: hypothetical protein ACON49_07745 [Candidatus Puniceispirillaceae bacterium]
MASKSEQNQRPAGVPEENVYKTTHWTIYLGYGVAVLAIAVLLFGQ